MNRNLIFATFCVGLLLCQPPAQSWARGFGGGGFGGGGFRGGGFGGGGFGGGGLGGGGFGGGMRMGGFGGGFGGGAMGGGGFGGEGFGRAGFDRGAGGIGGMGFDRGGAGGFNRGEFGGGLDRGLGAEGRGAFGDRGLGSENFGGDRFSTPTRSQLNSFLGLPSDEGLHSLSGGNRVSGDGFDVNRGVVEGPRGGTAAGATVTGPRGNTVGRGVAVGPEGGVVAGRGFEGAGGAAGFQGAAVGPGGRVAAGGAVRGPLGGEAARGVIAGPRGFAAGFARFSPSGRYVAAAAVRDNFHSWGLYGPTWYARYPGAWYAFDWAAGTAWFGTTWDSIGNTMNYYPAAPIFYDYGNNITYQDNDVYVNGQDVGTAEQYFSQAATLATAGTQADAPASGNWLPLGVFAFCKPDQKQSDVVIQLAINSEGILRGNYTDTAIETTKAVHGTVDKKTQRVAFTVGDNTTNVVETGLYNLTKDETPALIHFGNDRTEQWLLVRLKKPVDPDGN